MIADDRAIVLVTFRIPAGWMRAYMRWVRHRDPELPYTFPNMEFAAEPPGLRTGPWPGWRGIPMMHVPRLNLGDTVAEGQPQFHGDEYETDLLRVAYMMDAHAAERIVRAGVEMLELDVPHEESAAGAFAPVSMHLECIGSMPHEGAADASGLRLRVELRGVHPRLLFPDPDALRTRARSSHADAVRAIESLLDAWDLPHDVSLESKVLPGPERLAPEDRVLVSALLALLDPSDAAMHDRATGAFLDVCTDVRARALPQLGIDTQSGELLFVLALAYDWLHAVLADDQRATACAALRDLAGICRSHLAPGRTDYAQAHWLGCALGLLAWCFVCDDGDPRVNTWLDELRGAFGRVIAMLPQDGFYPHGINLWIYEHGFLYRWLELLRQCGGEDLWHATPYWRASAHFRLASMSHDLAHGITFGDPQFHTGGDAWCLDLVEARTDLHDARMAADAVRCLDPAGVDYRNAPPRRRVYEFLWWQPDWISGKVVELGAQHYTQATPLPLGEGPGERVCARTFFPDGGHVCIRSGEALLVFRAGAPIGRARRAAGERGCYGHTDPCSGAFLLWDGRDFIASGPGPVYRRDTALQNLVTIDGRGHIGDGCVWLPDVYPDESIPDAPEITTKDNRTRISAELTRCCLAHLGVRLHTRTLDVRHADRMRISGEDALELDSEREITWHFHTWCTVRVTEGGDAFRAVLTGSGAAYVLRMTRLAGMSCTVAAEEFVPAYPHDGTRGTDISFSVRTAGVRFTWSLEPFA